ncbi:MAG: OpgC domain-containing protein [Rhodobacteraceae bacterium]|nr:OpgC domain-containing protein [Paracoccaceae bacterium]
MATTTPDADFTAGPARRPAPALATARDPRLDFYRGIAMFIILIAHTPGNWWNSWIPARFGFSDATEIFVFCSGMASAIAFGGSFVRAGWWVGTARVLFRCWQVYWAHICLFFCIAMLMAALDTYGDFSKNYVNSLNLGHFFRDPMPQIVGLFTLTYVPNYFDILPMYLGILLMLPVLMALASVHVALAASASLTVWGLANLGLLPLPAEPWSDRQWFFDPFGWQLLFFTGFAFMRGWIPAPPVTRALTLLALGLVIFSAPWGSWKVLNWIGLVAPDLRSAIHATWPAISELRDKTEFGALRYLHFLALAYLGYAAAGAGGRRLIATGRGPAAAVWRWLLAQITKVGQQSLAVFVFSMVLGRVSGFVMDQIGRDPWVVSAVNLAGFALLIAVAYTAAWFKSAPWKRKPA